MTLFDGIAIGADEELGSTAIMAMATTDEGVQRFDLVGQAQTHQEIQGTVDGWRFGCARAGLEQFQQIIGFYRCIGLKKQLQYAVTHRCEALAPLCAQAFCGLKGPNLRIVCHRIQI